MKRLRIICLFVLIGTMAPGTLRAQTYAAVPVSIVISEILILQPDASPALNFDFSSTTALDNGINITGTTLRYYSNKSYFVMIQAGSAHFSGGQGNMPASVLKFRTTLAPGFTDLTSAPEPLAGTTGVRLTRGTGTFGVDFRMDPGYAYPPADNYSITVIYTISNQ